MAANILSVQSLIKILIIYDFIIEFSYSFYLLSVFCDSYMTCCNTKFPTGLKKKV